MTTAKSCSYSYSYSYSYSTTIAGTHAAQPHEAEVFALVTELGPTRPPTSATARSHPEYEYEYEYEDQRG